jgi:hypothetical protein
MARKVLRRQCGWGKQCPGIEITEGGDVEITGYEPGAEQTAENERTIVVPPTVVPELVSLDIVDFDSWLDARLRSPGHMLRVQTLQRYGAEDEYVRAYHEGRPGPADDELAAWGAELDAHRLADQEYCNLHVINGPLSREMQMQFGWAYTYNAAHHMQVRILDVAEHPSAAALLRLGDFWVVEREHVALCRYDADGRPLGTVEIEAAGAAGYRAVAEMGWHLSTEFEVWWAAHPGYHPAARRAA